MKYPFTCSDNFILVYSEFVDGYRYCRGVCRCFCEGLACLLMFRGPLSVFLRRSVMFANIFRALLLFSQKFTVFANVLAAVIGIFTGIRGIYCHFPMSIVHFREVRNVD